MQRGGVAPQPYNESLISAILRQPNRIVLSLLIKPLDNLAFDELL